VSPWTLYSMARRYDEWRGSDYDGSSARGAMKGWHKHGVCAKRLWPDSETDDMVTGERAIDAGKRPLGCYFRVNHKDLVAMHAALAEVGVVYASALTHAGWDDVGSNGIIPHSTAADGGHAFAIVGYDAEGFWIQNSWGPGWGKGGFGRLSYEDWLDNAYDTWVARLGAPVRVEGTQNVGTKLGGLVTSRMTFADIRPHIISIGNNGALRETGTYGNAAAHVHEFFGRDFPRITRSWKKRRILLYAHGGLVAEDNAIQRVENYLPALLEGEIYPFAFIWKTDFWTTVTNMLKDVLRRRRTEGALDAAKDFMLDRLDDSLERVARIAQGKKIWDEMKENALRATMRTAGGARVVLTELRSLLARDPAIEIHVAGHSAGAIFMAPLVQMLTTNGAVDPKPIDDISDEKWEAAIGAGLRIKTCTLWAPACTTALFKAGYLPAIAAKNVEQYTQFNLTDSTERDDHCARTYNKSLLYLVSNALETKPRSFLKKDGTPILGMDKFVEKDDELQRLFRSQRGRYVLTPNEIPAGEIDASGARHHGDFDDDRATVRSTLAYMLGKSQVKADMTFNGSASSARDRRLALGYSLEGALRRAGAEA
jgi:Papain family cysteine protease